MKIDQLSHMDKDDLLAILGLETKRGPIDYLTPGLTAFGVGLLVGAGIGLLIAPRPGRELREDLSHRLQEVPSNISQLPHKANEALSHAAEKVGETMNHAKTSLSESA